MTQPVRTSRKPAMLLVAWAGAMVVLFISLRLYVIRKAQADAGLVSRVEETAVSAAPLPETPAPQDTAVPDKGAQIQQDIADGKIAALVNGEPIYYRDLDAGLPAGTVGPRLVKGRMMRIDRLIYTVEARQFLANNSITVPPEEVEAQIEEFRKEPPVMGCQCCRYKDLEEFLELNS